MMWEDLKPSRIVTRGSFQNAMAVQMALGGSTNAAMHVIAMAGAPGIALTLDDLDAMAAAFQCWSTCFRVATV